MYVCMTYVDIRQVYVYITLSKKQKIGLLVLVKDLDTRNIYMHTFYLFINSYM